MFEKNNTDQLNKELLKLLDLALNDKEAFTQFASKAGGRIFSIAYRITNDKMHAEDVLNTVLLKTWQNLEKIVKLKNPLGYINTIAYNAGIDIKRKVKEFPLFDNIEEVNTDLEAIADIKDALNILSEQEREIVLYHVHAGYTFREIAMLTGLTKKMVYTRYINATKKLKEFLEY